MTDFNDQTEFLLAWSIADGSLNDIRVRFRVPNGAPIRRHEDGTVIDGNPDFTPDASTAAAGAVKLIIIPKPAEIPRFVGATWSADTCNAGETLTAFVKRMQTASPRKGEVYHAEDADGPDDPDEDQDVLTYIWFDWRNAAVRARVLDGKDEDARKKNDADPGAATLPQDTLSFPIKPQTVVVAPVAPGPVGGDAPKATIDVSETDFSKLQAAIISIEATLAELLHLRTTSIQIQSQCSDWIRQIIDIRQIATADDEAWKIADPAAGDLGRSAFLGAVDALLAKAMPPMFGTPEQQLAPTLIRDFSTAIQSLVSQITDKSTISLLDKVIPFQGDMPWFVEHNETAAGANFTVNHVCEVAATACYWIGESADRAMAHSLLDAAVAAMSAGKPPSAAAQSIIDFAVAIPFYPDTVNPQCHEEAPAALCGVVSQVFLTLQSHEAMANQAPATASTAVNKIGDAQAAVLGQFGWTTWLHDFRQVSQATKDPQKLWGTLMKAYSRPDQPKSDEALAALKAASLFKKIDESEQLEGASFVALGESIQAVNKFGQPAMDKAWKAVNAMDGPSLTFFRQFQGVEGALAGLGTILNLTVKIGADVSALTSDKGDLVDSLKIAKGAVDIVKDTLSGAKKLTIFTSVEAEEVIVRFGRVSLLMGIAVETVAVFEAIHDNDTVGAVAHTALAVSGLCFLLGGNVVVIVGSVLLVAGTVVLLARGELFKSDVGLAMAALFPGAGKADEFENRCSAPFALALEIGNMKTTFGNATFDQRLMGSDAVRRQNPGGR